MKPAWFLVVCVVGVGVLGLAGATLGGPAAGPATSPGAGNNPGGWPPGGQAVRAEVTRDNWVSAFPSEENGNNGGATRLKTKGIVEMTLLDIDPKPLAGRVILGATLHLNCQSPDVQRRLTVSTLASEWVEGTSRSYREEKGSSSFRWAKQDQERWGAPGFDLGAAGRDSGAGGDLTAACNGQGNTIWRFADATPPDGKGWQVVAVEPAVVAARVAGISQGFVVTDDVGSEYQRDGEKFTYHQFPNRFIASRESGRATAPYMTVYLGQEDKQPPAAPRKVAMVEETELLPSGEARLTWDVPPDGPEAGPAGTLGFDVRLMAGDRFDWDLAMPVPRHLIPMARQRRTVTMHLRDMGLKAGERYSVGVRAIDAAGNIGPVTTAVIRLPDPPAFTLPAAPVKPFTEMAPLPKIGGVEVAVIDLLDKVQPASGQMIPIHAGGYLQANHLWSAKDKHIRLYAGRNENVAFQVLLKGQTEGVAAALAWSGEAPAPGAAPLPQAKMYRFRHVNTPAGPLPDPLVPLAGAVVIPSTDEKIAAQDYAAFVVDIYVPHEARAGRHAGVLTLQRGADKLAIDVELNIWDFTLPDYLSFMPEMNCYGLPSQPGTVLHNGYYRLAHENRTCLNRLGYNWQGRVNDGCGPAWNGREFDWGAWDKACGPLLDGSAFSDLPRKGVPVDTFYLPLNENWPMSIDQSFKGGYWVESAFAPGYREALVEASRRFAEHFRTKGWADPLFEFYLNNKVYFKEQGKKWSFCSAPWVFDEPVATQDFWALRWYGLAFHEGAERDRAATQGPAMTQGSGVPYPHLVFRCDISRPQWQRNILDGVLDINVVGGTMRPYLRAVMDRKAANREVVINYGTSNPVERSNVQPAAWCVDAWCLGADGVLPWQTVGKAESWEQGDALSIFYPPLDGGDKDRPVASVRLKSYRQGQQDVEYLTLLSQTRKLPRWAVARAVREALKLEGKTEKRGDDDAGTVDYAAADPVALWELRLRVGAMLDQSKPAAQRRLIDLRPPMRDAAATAAGADVGYVSPAPPVK